MKVKFMNVGHGDTTLLIFENSVMLIDCNIDDESSDVFKELKNNILKKENGKEVIDYLVITHTDKDHIKGLEILNKNFIIKEIWESGYRKDKDDESDEYKYFLELLKDIKTIQLTAGENPIEFSEKNVDIYCLCSNSKDDEEIHYNGLVIKIENSKKSILFAGDSNKKAWENKIIKYYDKIINSDILHASHHGSKTFFFADNDEKLDDPYLEAIKEIKPTYTIISGWDPENKDKENFPPHEEAIKIYEDYTYDDGGVYITGRDETLDFDISDDMIELNEDDKKRFNESNYRKGKFRSLRSILSQFVNKIYKNPKFKVDYKKYPKWDIKDSNEIIKIEAYVDNRQYKSGEYKIAKEKKIKFTASIALINVINNWHLEWQITNTGIDAINHSDVRGDFYHSFEGSPLCWEENTKYSGEHCVQCFLIANDKCLGHSEEFIVNIY